MAETSYCFIHHEDEPVPQDCFLICYECKHVYRTPQDLVNEHNAAMDMIHELGEKWTPVTVERVEDIYSCPVCIHDF
jgi:hypothetical protein